MRISRITWPGAFHHVMSRGHDGRPLFRDKFLKEIFLGILADKAKQLKIRILAYCILDTHYHLVLENSSGCLSAMMKRINSQFAIAYRKRNPGRGSIFQDRFKSILIENDAYLISSIMYTLFNPVRAGLVQYYGRYLWSSAGELLSGNWDSFIDKGFVLDLFTDREGFIRQMDAFHFNKTLGIKRSQFGEILGGDGFLAKISNRCERRSRPDAVRRKRKDDRYFEPLAKVIYEFEKMIGKKVECLDLTTWHDKKLRGELLVDIREHCGLKYSEIAEIPIFSDIQLGSLGSLYWHSKRRKKKIT
ncbi:MAG: transposase [Chrysiogenales bacterium]